MQNMGHQPAEVSDELLVRRAQQGETAAFETLYRANAGRVHALCLRMCGDPALAEELAQEAFVRAWQRLGSFQGKSALSTWLHRLTVNVVLGHHRSRVRRHERESVAAEAAAEPPRGVDRKAQAIDLERAIRTLPDRARTVFVLHDIEGYRHAEIADMADMAVGTSKAQLSRARKLLRKALSS
jgi:RNA polymerase sigma-70 factor (ECF subfamily)